MPLGARGHIGLTKEVTFGTPVAAADWVPFISESIKEEIETIQDPSIRTVLDENEPYQGLKKYSGDIALEAFPDVMGHFLRSAMGAPVTTVLGTNEAYQHVFQPANTDFAPLCAVPPYTLEINRDLPGGQSVQYAGAVVDGLNVSFGTDQKVAQAQVSIIAAKRATVVKTTPTFGTNAPLLWTAGKVEIAAVANTDVEKVTVSYKNGLAGKATLDGGTEINRIYRDGLRTLDLDLQFDLTTEAEYTKFLAGTVSAMNVVLEGPIIATTYKYTLKFEFPRVKYVAFPINVGGPKRLTVAAKAKPSYDKTLGYAVKVTLINLKTSY